jgi:hypothetical protein
VESSHILVTYCSNTAGNRLESVVKIQQKVRKLVDKFIVTCYNEHIATKNSSLELLERFKKTVDMFIVTCYTKQTVNSDVYTFFNNLGTIFWC